MLNDKATYKKVELNLRRNAKQDNTEALDAISKEFVYADCANEYWNPEEFSLLYGTPLWDQASKAQRVLLNQLYWTGYYSQIISAEIATIFLNSTAAAGLYGKEDFRIVCDALDFESHQERAHINAFKTVSEAMEKAVFGERIFTYPMRSFAAETMIFQDTSKLRAAWKKFQIHFFAYLSSDNAFIASQYLTVRGLRTLNGKIVQHQLSQYYAKHDNQDKAPIPSKISWHHFLDESYHFNSSTLIGHEVVKSLKPPTAFEKKVVNMAIKGCQRDHFNFNCSVNGIFWYEPALFATVYKVLCSRAFGFGKTEALELMRRSFCEDNQGIQLAYKTHHVARESYQQYLSGLDFLDADNKNLTVMKQSTVAGYLKRNRRAFNRFVASLN
ncbi:MAG: P-aminobenzoate N-oxygenase AurF [Candidatus Melainabacteria bacterium HGW-Melainabacteria-1]|nr:MAG: P-aminobenzoate N-oxygenase AurF [Candidatus Melainabacteria bacterium HGW-Melainabacteria-1]